MKKLYHENGSLFLECTTDESGVEKIIQYHENGEISEIQYWKKKIPHGEFKEFDEFGYLLSEKSYDKGKLFGAHIIYFSKEDAEKEKKVKRYSLYEAGVKHGIEKSYIDEMLYIETEWKQGCKTGYEKVYQNGKLDSVTPYVNGLKEGSEKRYSPSGALWITVNYINDEKCGEEITYNTDGKIKKVESFYDGMWYIGEQSGE